MISYGLDATRGLIASYAAPLLPRKQCQLCSTSVAFGLDCISLKADSGPPGKHSSLQILIASPNAANEVMMRRVKNTTINTLESSVRADWQVRSEELLEPRGMVRS